MSEAAENRVPVSIRAGNILHGKYRLERELGRGAMGTVWSAIHLSLDQRVAIKVISSEYADSNEAIQRFHTEAKAAAKLRSRYVVQVYDDGETPDGLPYIVMEYLEGESLEDRIARDGDIQLTEAVRIATHVGRALSRAHRRGIVHRDLKPANIFITRNEEDDVGWVAKVLDFGIAKLDDNREKSTTKTGTVLGTPLFMSAEQVRGASTVDARADLYSLGMVVYNMLTGGYAFEGSSFGDLLVSICTDPLPKLADAAPWAPQALENWFQKACARDVSQRFQSADEMIDELHAAANLSFDGRMSFSDENSSLTQLLPPSQALIQKASLLGNEAPNNYAAAATQAAESVTITGDASVHTIPGVTEKKRWLLPAIAGGGVLVALAALLWFVAAGNSQVAAAEAATDRATAAQPELAEPASTIPPGPAPAPVAEDPTEPPEEPAAAAEAEEAKPDADAKLEPQQPSPKAATKAGTKQAPTPRARATKARATKKPVKKPNTIEPRKALAPAEVDIGF